MEDQAYQGPVRQWRIGPYKLGRIHGIESKWWEFVGNGLGASGRTPWTAWWHWRQWRQEYQRGPGEEE